MQIQSWSFRETKFVLVRYQGDLLKCKTTGKRTLFWWVWKNGEVTPQGIFSEKNSKNWHFRKCGKLPFRVDSLLMHYSMLLFFHQVLFSSHNFISPKKLVFVCLMKTKSPTPMILSAKSNARVGLAEHLKLSSKKTNFSYRRFVPGFSLCNQKIFVSDLSSQKLRK